MSVEIYTIGFTQKSAEEFFTLLKENDVRRLVDIRLNNKSQLAGFTKQQDLEFFLREIAGIEYVDELRLAPTPELLTGYRKNQYTWADYERIFGQLLEERETDKIFSPEFFRNRSVLLCSEPTPDQCHRRLIAEYFQQRWGDVEIVHL